MDSSLRCYGYLLLWCFLITGYCFSVFSLAASRITRGQSIGDGETMISEGGRFALGFFGPQGSGSRYVGIWYQEVGNESVVWVANRERPISGNGGVLTIGNDGNLMVMDGNGDVVWSTNLSVRSSNSTAVLMDTGNLVLFGSENLSRGLWQSFDHPTDTYLPNMKVYMDVRGEERRVFTSWRSAFDPSPGNYSMGIDPRWSPQIVIWDGANRRWRSGHWDGLTFTGVPGMKTSILSGFRLLTEADVVGKAYFIYSQSNGSDLIKFRINWEGIQRLESWVDERKEWSLTQLHPGDECDRYNHCGPFGKCNEVEVPKCSCMEGFVPKDTYQWSRENWSGGCVRQTNLQCMENNSLSVNKVNDDFVTATNVKLPDYVDYVGREDIQQCQNMCLQNCSCTAYAFLERIGCMIWYRDLVDVQQFQAEGSTLFIRRAHSELVAGDKSHVTKIVIITIVIAGLLLVCVSIWLLVKRKTKCSEILHRNEMPKVGPSGEFSTDFSGPCDLGVEGQKPTGNELAMFNFNHVAAATNNFSSENKLGQGGFGHVYKGTLPGGQQIAVKRLSRKSGQGLEEFKNEIMLIAKLQHRNLVRLLGCCIEGEEKMLLYEYMPNKSLDSYLFDTDKKAQLAWSKRFSIIEGIARGLVYLHRDSRLRIIHRDLKASNILLDEEMNPKISDFGMARIFGGNQNEANTNRVVGTYGYMAPEYAMEGLFSLKSDVYSFGVLLLEIISGRRNTSFRSTKYSNIIGYAWDLWDRGRAMELVDPSISNSCSEEQVVRCVNVGLLCVQDMADHRPNMPTVVLMLESEKATLSLPKQPTFTSMRHNLNADMWNEIQDAVSSNSVTITAILGRRETLRLEKMRNIAKHHPVVRVSCFIIALTTFFPLLSTSIDLITPTQFLDKDQTLVSAGQEFELGFFSYARSNNWYIGIWYKNIEQRTIVWVANRDSPLRNSSGILKISPDDGNLLLVDEAGKSVWSSNHSGMAKNSVAELLDNGNFVVRPENEQDPENYLWQSFDYPTNTLLPGMKMGWDSKTGLNRYITSWKSADDPSSGDYSFQIDVNGFPEIYLMNKERIYYRSGPWNGLRFSGVPEMKSSTLFSFLFVMEPDEVSYSFDVSNKSVYSRLMVKHSGELQRFIWIPATKIWSLFWYAPKDQCDRYRECGVYGICDANASPVCKCIQGFEPKNPQAWNLRDGSDGCFRVSKLDCRSDGFLTLNHVKLPESGTAFVDKQMNLDQCQELCRKNCSCRGYSNINITGGGTGCAIWIDDLYDMRQYAVAEGGQDFYVRVPAADLERSGAVGTRDDSNKTGKIVMAVGIAVGVLLVGLAVFFVWKRGKSRSAKKNIIEHRGPRERSQDFLLNVATIPNKRDHSGETAADELDLPLFDLSSLLIATDNFSNANKLGQGGFGCVYKGMLVEGQVIAVKRLSKNSGQGIDEFKNEVKLIARLQHRNLVRLLGCCIEMEEKMLVYEYMENKSLDSILFKKDKSSMLDWERRFNIICGIARGLLYLHQDSRFRIIHRDLKASNILLDKEMNPKISDFGMARIFGGDQTEANTKRVVGTYGYMSPEYAMDGLFSIKSDVFSFGVLVLEIVSGTKNRGFYQTNNHLNLLAYAWKLYREGRGLELMDTAAGESYSASEVMRCIQVGLLCVQEHAEDRPNMSTVVLMLSSDFVSMPQPKHPGYCLGRRPADTDSFSSKPDESCTVNQVTVTMLDGR
ncbi:uncharacterized protein LOC105175473 [Sesamum indicum]|uniref:non-specific serine/threonine protein kinase n=1 Tax=Sesamum indicum TaxID=4182 RepID=A0A8M8VD30_SESIN|nr:uncharacterized protein LOC105175473 [Sesamum indicum]